MTQEIVHTVSSLPMPPAEELPQAGPAGEATRSLGWFSGVWVSPTLRDATVEIPAVPAEVADDQTPGGEGGSRFVAALRRLFRADQGRPAGYRGAHRYGRATASAPYPGGELRE